MKMSSSLLSMTVHGVKYLSDRSRKQAIDTIDFDTSACVGRSLDRYTINVINTGDRSLARPYTGDLSTCSFRFREHAVYFFRLLFTENRSPESRFLHVRNRGVAMGGLWVYKPPKISPSKLFVG